MTWVKDNAGAINEWTDLPNNQQGQGMVYDTVLTMTIFMAIIIRKTALYIYRYRNGTKVLPKLYAYYNKAQDNYNEIPSEELPMLVNNALYKQFILHGR